MREKTWKIVVTFYTTTQAMRMEHRSNQYQLEGRIIPVPREISAGCGMAWCSPVQMKDRVKLVLYKEQIEVEGTYELLL